MSWFKQLSTFQRNPLLPVSPERYFITYVDARGREMPLLRYEPSDQSFLTLPDYYVAGASVLITNDSISFNIDGINSAMVIENGIVTTGEYTDNWFHDSPRINFCRARKGVLERFATITKDGMFSACGIVESDDVLTCKVTENGYFSTDVTYNNDFNFGDKQFSISLDVSSTSFVFSNGGSPCASIGAFGLIAKSYKERVA